jgi:hypothetical protein
VTWPPVPAPDGRSLAAAADMIVPALADVAIIGIRRLVQRGLPVGSVPRRQLVSPVNFPGPTGHREGRSRPC